MKRLFDHLSEVEERIDRCDRLVLCLDFDGTLVPIVDDPEEVALDSETRATLSDLQDVDTVELAIVSGRAVDDVRARAGVAGITYAGNHGLVIERESETWRHPIISTARPELEQAIAGIRDEIEDIPGAFVEDKFATASVHYRNTPADRREDVKRIASRHADSAESIRLSPGKAVRQLRPAVEWDKGAAIDRIVDEPSPGTLTAFAGDDETDADGFDRLDRLDGDTLTIGVGATSLPAEFLADDYQEVRRWLAWLRDRVESPVNTGVSV